MWDQHNLLTKYDDDYSNKEIKNNTEQALLQHWLDSLYDARGAKL